MCLALCTDKARKVRDYYIAMEEVMFDYTRCKMAVKDAEHAAELAAATQKLPSKLDGLATMPVCLLRRWTPLRG